MAGVPSEFGPYQLVRRLGVGGMAETFLAIRRGLGGFEQRVCVKRILPAFEEDEEFVRLFLQEARLAARLRHGNIVQVIDFGQVDSQHYLALELVDGLDLRHLIQGRMAKQERLPAEVVALVALGVANALEYAHTYSDGPQTGAVFHRDISPSNVLVSASGEIKLTDFGIAKAAGHGQVTQTGVIKGKLPYLPPEYLKSNQFDARGDLFALGIMLYEALTGARPYDGRHEFETLERSSRGEHLPLLAVAPDTPLEFAEAVERLIQPEPEQRYQSAYSFLEAMVPVSVTPMTSRVLARLIREETSSDPKASSVASHPPSAASDVSGSAPPKPSPRAQGVPPTRTQAAAPLEPNTRTSAHLEAADGSQPRIEGALAVDHVQDPSVLQEAAASPKSGLTSRGNGAQHSAGEHSAVEHSAAEHSAAEHSAAEHATLEPSSSAKFAIAPPAPDDGAAEAFIPPSASVPRPARRKKWLLLSAAALVLPLAVAAFGLFQTQRDRSASTSTSTAGKTSKTERAGARVAQPKTSPPEDAKEGAAPLPPALVSDEVETELGDEPEGENANAEKPRVRRRSRTSSLTAQRPPPTERVPRPSANADYGRLRVIAVPFGHIYVDGENRGPSPMEAKLSPGVHRVYVRGESKNFDRRLNIKAGDDKRLFFRTE